MGLFDNIRNAIFGGAVSAATAQQGSAPPLEPASPAPAEPATPAPAPAPALDVGAVLSAMADAKGGGGNYRTSIVDLLSLLDLDSSLDARKRLARELGVTVGEDGTAERNIALHRAVMAKLAENGGIVPDDLRS